MQNVRHGRLMPVASEFATTELRNVQYCVQRAYGELLAIDTDITEIAKSALELANTYQARVIRTPKSYDDGWPVIHFNKIRLFSV
jgi:hypothetical protein